MPAPSTISLAIAFALAAVEPGLAPPAIPAQVLTGLAGAMWDVATPRRSYAWKLEYQEGLGEHVQYTVSWLNEGHIEGHHRDGYTLQLWARTAVLSRRLTLSLGGGGYRYFDTADRDITDYANHHGWGGILSAGVSYHFANRLVLRADINRVWADPKTIDTRTALVGIGYQLQAPAGLGPRDRPRAQADRTARNELTVFIGRTVVNSFASERSVAVALEYRRAIGQHVDWSLTVIDEGDPMVIRRDGVATQLWGVRSFFTDRLMLGIGGGVYLAADEKHRSAPSGEGTGTVAGLVTPTVGWRFSRHVAARFNWERTVSRYDRDTDIFLLGLGYRF
jgi:hypothetical protein